MSQLQTIMSVWNFGLALPGSPKFLTGTSPSTMACMDWHLKMKTQNYWFESELFILFYFILFLLVCVCGKAQPQIQPTCSWQQCWAVLWSFKESSVWFLNISESKNRQFQFFEKYSESKNCPFHLFEKTSKNGWSSWKNRQRTDDSLASSFTVKTIWEPLLYTKTIYLKILRTGR